MASMRDIAVAALARCLVEHPVGENPIALALDENVIVFPGQEVERALEESPQAKVEADAGVRSMNEASRIVMAQEVRVQALGGAEEFLACGHVRG